VVGIGGAPPAGYARIKVKLAMVADIDRVAAIREAVGDVVEIAVDANGAFSERDIDSLRRLADLDVLFIEQPFAEPMRVDLGTPICLDESITSYDDALRAIDLGLADVISIKAARLGGYPEAKRVHDLCHERGVPAWCGGMYDAGVSKAANLALAGLPGFIGGDLAASDHYFAGDITEPFVLDDGYLAVPDGPGIGVIPDPDVLADVVTHRVLCTGATH
jgi:O-succinylbenzoate synthase